MYMNNVHTHTHHTTHTHTYTHTPVESNARCSAMRHKKNGRRI